MKMKCDVCKRKMSVGKVVLVSESINDAMVEDSWLNEKKIVCCNHCILNLNFRDYKAVPKSLPKKPTRKHHKKQLSQN